MSALASLAERPELVERLFVTKRYCEEGAYRLRLCKNGEWQSVTVDDYIPCFPDGGPIFSRNMGNELWVLLIEKAYAKLHGGYLELRGGYASEGMQDLTGCPTVTYDMHNELVHDSVQKGDFWNLLEFYDQEGFLISASTPGEE